MSESEHIAAPPADPVRVGRRTPYAAFAVSAVFHYLGPAFAVLLFAPGTFAGVDPYNFYIDRNSDDNVKGVDAA